jgi:hypothetical protein
MIDAALMVWDDWVGMSVPFFPALCRGFDINCRSRMTASSADRSSERAIFPLSRTAACSFAAMARCSASAIDY